MTTIAPLNPLATHDAAASLRNNILWKRVWTVAFAASIIAFTALGVLAITLTSTFWPAHLPLVTILVVAIGLQASGGIVTKLWDKRAHYKAEASYDQNLKKGMEVLSSDELSKTLKKIGFSSEASDPVKRTLLSRYNLLKQTVENNLKEAKIEKEVELYVDGKVHTIRPADYHISKVDFEDLDQAEIFEALQDYQLRRQELLHRAALAQLLAAYTLYLIQNPKDMRDFENVLQFTARNPRQHMIAKLNGDPTAFVIAKTARGSFKRDQILSTSAAKLSAQIFGLKRNWSFFRFW